MSARGRFVTVEGIEGAGKSTQVRDLCTWLGRQGIEALATREPGGTRLGERIRELLLAPELGPMDPAAELLLIFAARAEHIAQVIEPALARGCWVICDRFTDATYAYQGGGRAIESARIGALERSVQDELRPVLTVLLDIEPDIGLARARARGEGDRFENETLQFYARVRQRYLELAEREPRRYRVIDAGRPLEDVRRDMRAAVAELLEAG